MLRPATRQMRGMTVKMSNQIAGVVDHPSFESLPMNHAPIASSHVPDAEGNQIESAAGRVRIRAWVRPND